MTVPMSPETEQRALEILRTPMTALAFADAFWPDRIDRPPGKRALAGHALLRRFIASGSVRRIEGASPSADLFVASDAQPEPYGAPAAEPEEPEAGELAYEDGFAVRVRKEVLGPIALPPPPPPRVPPPQRQPPPPQHSQQPPAAPQYAPPPQPPQLTKEQIFQQYTAWCRSQAPEWAALNALGVEVDTWRHSDGTPLDAWEHQQKQEQVERWIHAIGLQNYQWLRAIGIVPPNLQFDRELGIAEPPPRAPMRRPPPYASRPNGAARPW